MFIRKGNPRMSFTGYSAGHERDFASSWQVLFLRRHLNVIRADILNWGFPILSSKGLALSETHCSFFQ